MFSEDLNLNLIHHIKLTDTKGEGGEEKEEPVVFYKNILYVSCLHCVGKIHLPVC